jgi:hypothetical protein
MIDYDTEFIVKYYDIKKELEGKKNDSKEYTEDDIVLVIDELYRHELLSVFRSEDICDEKIFSTMIVLWDSLREYPPFLEFFNFFRKKVNDNSMDNDEFFTSLFCFDTFYIFHKCICEFLIKREISPEILEQLKNAIDTF